MHAKGQVDGAALSAESVTQYRAVVARGNYLASDRPDIAFAIKDAAKHMATPTTESWELMKRVGKYLVTKPRLLWWFKFQDLPSEIAGRSDSDWAGCTRSRKSTSGGTVQFGRHLLNTWSRTQDIISRSSAEAELYAGVKCSAGVLRVVSCFPDVWLQLESRAMADASAALGCVTDTVNPRFHCNLSIIQRNLFWNLSIAFSIRPVPSLSLTAECVGIATPPHIRPMVLCKSSIGNA